MADLTGTQELRGILDETTVGEMTLTGYPVLAPGISVMDAIREMRATKHGSALVCEDYGLVGIFTERDFLRTINEGNVEKTLGDVMTQNPTTVSVDDSLLTAVRLLDKGGYRRLPVVDADGNPAGVLDVKTVSHFIVENFPEAIYNQAARDELLAKNPEGA